MARNQEKKRKLEGDSAKVENSTKRAKKSKPVENSPRVENKGLSELAGSEEAKKKEGDLNGPRSRSQVNTEESSQLQEKIPLDQAKSSTVQGRRRPKERAYKKGNVTQNELTTESQLDMTVMQDPDSTPFNGLGTSPSHHLRLFEQDKREKDRRWYVSPRAAGAFINQDPIFVQDESGDDCIISATGHEVMLMSLDTSIVLRSHIVPHGRNVASFCLGATKKDLLIVAYDNGEIIEWNWNTSKVSSTKLGIDGEVVSLAVLTGRDGEVYPFYVVDKENKSSIVYDGVTLFESDSQISSFRLLCDGRYILALTQRCLIIGSRKDGTESDYTWVELPSSKKQHFTCFDARAVKGTTKHKNAPFKLVVAVGNSRGQILLYPDVLPLFSTTNATLQTPSLLHWHRTSVLTAKFSNDGIYLITGGHEPVLVLEQLVTGRRSFLPRLPSSIEKLAISPNGSRYALQLANNSIVVINSTELEAIAYFHGLNITLGSSSGGSITMSKLATAIHPVDDQKLLLTTSASGGKFNDHEPRTTLQTFDMVKSTSLKEEHLLNTPSTDAVIGLGLEGSSAPDTHLIAVTHDGQWLATVEQSMPASSALQHVVLPERLEEEREKRRKVSLKFWQWRAHEQSWELNTTVPCPHQCRRNDLSSAGNGRVFKLVVNPSNNTFVTVGEDGEVRMWHGKRRKDANNPSMMRWAQKYKASFDIPPHTGLSSSWPSDRKIDDAVLTISEDGSLIIGALIPAYQSDWTCLHQHNAFTGERYSTMWTGAVPEKTVVDVAIMHRWLIILTPRTVRVWDLVLDEHIYTSRLPKSEDLSSMMLTVNKKEVTFAVLSGTGAERQVEVFGPQHRLLITKFNNTPLAVLSGPRTPGYKIVLSDCTIQTVLPGVPQLGSPLSNKELLSNVSGIEYVEDDEVEQEETSSSTSVAMVTTPTEDDRPVVRPEQLKALMDPGPGQPQPTMQEMFKGVINLFARKP